MFCVPLGKVLPVWPMDVFLQSGHTSLYTSLAENFSEIRGLGIRFTRIELFVWYTICKLVRSNILVM